MSFEGSKKQDNVSDTFTTPCKVAHWSNVSRVLTHKNNTNAFCEELFDKSTHLCLSTNLTFLYAKATR